MDTDVVAVDSYTAPVISPAVSNLTACAIDTNSTSNPHRQFPTCLNGSTVTTTGWGLGYPSQSTILYDFPKAFRWQLNYVWNRFGLPILVSEFGFQTQTPRVDLLQDETYNTPQSEYFIGYLSEILKAIWEDGVDVAGALMW